MLYLEKKNSLENIKNPLKKFKKKIESYINNYFSDDNKAILWFLSCSKIINVNDHSYYHKENCKQYNYFFELFKKIDSDGFSEESSIEYKPQTETVSNIKMVTILENILENYEKLKDLIKLKNKRQNFNPFANIYRHMGNMDKNEKELL